MAAAASELRKIGELIAVPGIVPCSYAPAAHGGSRRERVNYRSHTIRSSHPRKGMFHELIFRVKAQK
jgi:hypothetical protein